MSSLKRAFDLTLPVSDESVDLESFFIFVRVFRKRDDSKPTAVRDYCAYLFPGAKVVIAQRTPKGKNELNSVILYVPAGLYDPLGKRYSELAIEKSWNVTYRRELCSPWSITRKKEDEIPIAPEAKKVNFDDLGFL